MVGILLLGFLLTPTATQPPPGSGIDVVHYQVLLTPNLATRSIQGTERIEFRVLNGLDIAEFDCGELKIASVSDGKSALQFDVDERRLRVRWPTRLRAGTRRTIAITYSGTPRFGMTFVTDREQIYTVFSTSQWMVAIDAPAERATFRLTLRLPAAWTAAGSGEPAPVRVEQNRAVHEWHQAVAVPSYTYGFAAGRFLTVTERHGRVVLQSLADGFSEAELRQIVRDTPSMLDFFADRAGVPYGGRSYTQVLTERGIGQEMAGMAVLPESYGRDVLKDERETWLGAHESRAPVVGQHGHLSRLEALLAERGLCYVHGGRPQGTSLRARGVRSGDRPDPRALRARPGRRQGSSSRLRQLGPSDRGRSNDRLSEGRLRAPPASTRARGRDVLARHPRVHPAPLRRRRHHLRPAARDGARVRGVTGAILHTVGHRTCACRVAGRSARRRRQRDAGLHPHADARDGREVLQRIDIQHEKVRARAFHQSVRSTLWKHCRSTIH